MNKYRFIITTKNDKELQITIYADSYDEAYKRIYACIDNIKYVQTF